MSDDEILVWTADSTFVPFRGDDNALQALGSFVVRSRASGNSWAVKNNSNGRWDIYTMTPHDGGFKASAREVVTIVLESQDPLIFSGREYTESREVKPPLKAGSVFREVVARSVLWPN